jgi:cobalt-zinc-cadmium efflux system protein
MDSHNQRDHDPHDHHDHSHRSGHSHAPTSFGTAFAAGALLNTALVVAQVAYGVVAHSTALLADAAHNLGDVLGLLLAWGASVLARWHPTERFTYGFRSSSILAALVNAVILLIVTGAIAWEAIQRLFEPQPVAGLTVIIVAIIAVVVNGLSARLLSGGHGDLNVRGAYLHMLADAGVSAGVAVAGALILLTAWQWIDPIMSLAISAVIVWGTWSLLRESIIMSLQAVPDEIDPAKVRTYLEALPGVAEVHDLHIWPMSTTETALTCHLVMPSGVPDSDFFHRIDEELLDRFEIQHPTIQVERGDRSCKLAPAHVV